MANRGREALPVFAMPVIGDVTSVSRRLAKERRASPQAQERAIASGVQMNYTASTFQGSREGLQVGSSAYEAMSPHMKAIIDGFAWIRNRYYDGNPPSVSTIGEVAEMTQIGNSLVQYLRLRADSEFYGEDLLPDLAREIQQSCAGLRIGASNLLVSGYRETDQALVGAEMYKFLDETGQLTSQDGVYACAAPEEVIVAGYDVFRNSKFGDASRSELQTLIPDFRGLKTFSQVLLKYNDLKDDFARELRLSLEYAAYKKGRPLTYDERAEVVIKRSARVLSEFSYLQARGNISLGREAGAKLIAENLVEPFIGKKPS